MAADYKSTEILGVRIDAVTPEQALALALKSLKGRRPYTIFTAGPEFLMNAKKDPDFKRILNNSNLVVADGIGAVYASKLNEIKIKSRVTGCDLLQAIFAEIRETGETVYLFGGKPGIPELVAEKSKELHPGLKIAGMHNGYFDDLEEMLIIDDIIDKKPDILLVGLGSPKQEKWIAKNKKRLPAKLLIGVGGSFDVMSGKLGRAPKIFQKLGLEWLYRLIRQPSRIKRQIVLPKFVFAVLRERFR